MAKYFKTTVLLCFAALILSLGSCQEGGEAGNLLGQWRLSGTTPSYLSFSGSITSLRNGNGLQVFGNFQQHGDSLLIQCYSITGIPEDTIMVEQSFGFEPFNNIRLKIETLDSDKLIVSKAGKVWTFEKW